MGQRRDDPIRLAPIEFLLQQAEYSSRHSQRVAGQRWGQVGRNEGCEFHRLALVGRLSPGEKWGHAGERVVGPATWISLVGKAELRYADASLSLADGYWWCTRGWPQCASRRRRSLAREAGVGPETFGKTRQKLPLRIAEPPAENGPWEATYGKMSCYPAE